MILEQELFTVHQGLVKKIINFVSHQESSSQMIHQFRLMRMGSLQNNAQPIKICM